MFGDTKVDLGLDPMSHRVHDVLTTKATRNGVVLGYARLGTVFIEGNSHLRIIAIENLEKVDQRSQHG